ncbi:MAG: DUF488 domain-containing protein [Alphaproteobacteria bacterium]|nr:DUF488 domain-containing protein [Alphaproteobacteria bacterium]
MPEVSTIGYEGASLEDFIATLLLANIQTLIDVRELPISRRPGFAKTALSRALESVGINYVHLKGLGDPKEGREAAKANDYKEFLRIFSKHLKTPAAKCDLGEAAKITDRGGACLMCYERDPDACHRKLVAEKICDTLPAQIRHLGVKNGIAATREKAKGKGGGSRQGLAPCGQEAR